MVSLAQGLAGDTQPPGPRWEQGRQHTELSKSSLLRKERPGYSHFLLLQPWAGCAGAVQEHMLLQGKEKEEQGNVWTAAVPYQKHIYLNRRCSQGAWAPPVCTRRAASTRMGLTSLGWPEKNLKCRREAAHGMKRMRLLWAGCLEVPDLLVNGERILLCCTPAFRQNMVHLNQTSKHSPCSLFPVPFELRKEISAPRVLLSPAAEFSFYPSQHRVDWWSWDLGRGEEVKCGVWENKQPQAVGLINAVPCKKEITVVCISRCGWTCSWKDRAAGPLALDKILQYFHYSLRYSSIKIIKLRLCNHPWSLVMQGTGLVLFPLSPASALPHRGVTAGEQLGIGQFGTWSET